MCQIGAIHMGASGHPAREILETYYPGTKIGLTAQGLEWVPRRSERLELRPNIEHVYFSVDDIEATFERASRAGCSWLGAGIETHPWGERSFYARDPSGNPICFVQSGTEFTGGRFVP